MQTPEPAALTREQFDFMLAGIETQYQTAFEAAKGLSVFSCDARDIARQRRMNQMVENAIIQLEELTNITVACTRNETVNAVPFPPKPNRQQTILNFDNKR